MRCSSASPARLSNRCNDVSPAQSDTRSGVRYTSVAIFLHWIMAVGILALLVLGLTMTHVTLPLMRKFQLYQLHKSIGITILLAAFVRLAWRLTHRPPPLPTHMTLRERSAAEGAHVLLYVFLFGLPLTGWALVSASVLNVPTLLYGHIHWPHLPFLSTLPHKGPVAAVLKQAHRYAAWFLIAIVLGHALAALRHHWVQRDEVLRRMLPFTGGKLAASGRAPGLSSPAAPSARAE
jgi:cytochrome b561